MASLLSALKESHIYIHIFMYLLVNDVFAYFLHTHTLSLTLSFTDTEPSMHANAHKQHESKLKV